MIGKSDTPEFWYAITYAISSDQLAE